MASMRGGRSEREKALDLFLGRRRDLEAALHGQRWKQCGCGRWNMNQDGVCSKCRAILEREGKEWPTRTNS